MKVFECFIFAQYAIVAVILSLGQCESSTMSTSSSSARESLYSDTVQFVSAPDTVMEGSVVLVHSQCSKPCVVRVEVVVSTPTKTGVLIFRRRWTNHRHLHVPRKHLVELPFPPSMVYRGDFFVRRTLDVQDVMVRAWLDHLDSGNETGTYYGSLARTFKMIQTLPPSERPARPHTGCPSWMAELRWRLTKDRISRCPHEPATLDLLKFPLVSTGERFGVVRKLHPFINRGLESTRVHAVAQPRMTLSVWIYLLQWCGRESCAIIQHVDQKNEFITPLIQLTNTGDILFQVHLANGRDEAFRSYTALPLRTWIRLDFSIHGLKVTLQVNPGITSRDFEAQTHVYYFQNDIQYNDTNGYLVIGGSKHLTGIHGYFGPIKYYRLGTEKVINPLSPGKTLEDLDKTHRECEEIKQVTAAFLQALTKSELFFKTGLCHSGYMSLWRRFRQNTCQHTWSWETQIKYGALFSFIQTQQEDLTPGSWNWTSTPHIGSQLFEHVIRRMSNRGSAQMEPESSLIALLQVSSCYGHHQASLLLATIHLAGLGVSVDQQQGHVYSLIGAHGDDRLALMHLGYKHTQGIDGLPKDFDMAFSYYSNVGSQTRIDQERAVEYQQYPTEHIHLTSAEEMNRLTHETGDSFHFLKLQAERGDIESQKRLARILFWGQNGAWKDVGSAVKWYARSAMQMEDPMAMYDYSVLLLKGQGVKKNTSLGLQLLEKAAAMGSAPALNALGWYHCTAMKDYKTAVKYFEQAAQNGSHHAFFNLGVFHINGKHPYKPGKNETAAFHYFLKASALGHLDAAVEVGWYLATGNLDGVSQDAEKAVIMLKRICERNGYLGFVVREALQAYLKGSWGEALVRYALAAETGLGVAQNNVAHLCEKSEQSYDCQWRYHNYSTMNYAPHLSGLLKMGDYYMRLGASSAAVSQALSMYTRAALAGSPQGIYNLVVLAEEGHVVPLNIRDQFDVSPHDELDTLVEKLLRRCTELEDEEAVTPCSLALLKVQMGKAWSKITLDPVQLSLAHAAAITLMVALITMLIQSVLECIQANIVRSGHTGGERMGTSSVNQAEDNGNGLQDQRVTVRTEGRIPRRVSLAQPVVWLTLVSAGAQRLQRTSELTVTVSGVCLCAFCTLLLHHLL